MTVEYIDRIDVCELTSEEVDEVSAGILANIGMGIAGALGSMATYAISGGISGSLSGTGFLSAGAGGFVYGAGGFNSVSGYAGATVAGTVKALLED